MTPQRAIAFFKTQTALAAELNVTQPCVSNWLKRDRIPALQQLRIETASKGKLKADRNVRKLVSAK